MANILVVEDDRDLNNAYGIILKHEGHDVVQVYDGSEALEALKTFTPHLVLLDLLMPVMGGLEFLQQWHKQGNMGKVKVLIFTNMENSPEVNEAYKLGAQRCIIKSWTAPHNLAKVVTDTLQESSHQSGKPATQSASKA